MPELPDVTVYLEALERRILGHRLERVQLASPFLLRTAAPPISSVEHQTVVELRRLGKRICIGFENGIWLVIHLMIAGRLHWKPQLPAAARARRPSKFKAQIAVFEFDIGALSLTEAGTQRRASLHVVAGSEGLSSLDRGGVELFTRTTGGPNGGLGEFIDLEAFTRV